MKVTFISSHNSIPAGFEFELGLGESVRLNGILLNEDTVFDLEDLGIVSIDDGACEDCCNCVAPTSSTSSVTCYLVGEERNKVTEAVGADINNAKFVFGSEYKFYDIENRTWKVSRLKKTASHLGRIAGGFAVPVDATAKKMFNRLEKLNVMYNLGLNREIVRDITGYRN